MRLAAIQQSGQVLGYIIGADQTPILYPEPAVKRDGQALRFVVQPSVAICQAALHQNGLALEHVARRPRSCA